MQEEGRLAALSSITLKWISMIRIGDPDLDSTPKFSEGFGFPSGLAWIRIDMDQIAPKFRKDSTKSIRMTDGEGQGPRCGIADFS